METPVLESLFNKAGGLQVCNFIKKRLQHRCFPLSIANFFRIPILRKSANGCFCLFRSLLEYKKCVKKFCFQRVFEFIKKNIIYKKISYVKKNLGLQNSTKIKKHHQLYYGNLVLASCC